MLKESILFVASTGVLIYLIAPADAPPKPEPVVVAVQEEVPSAAPEDSWDYDDDDTEESFVFGEPVTVLDGDDDEDDESSSDQSELVGQVQPPNRASQRRSIASNGIIVEGRTPKPGAPGSIENPLALPTTNPNDR